MRIALGISYNGSGYHGWQSQLSGNTVQDHLETALTRFAVQRITTNCAGRTDSGVHGLMQVVHFDTDTVRDAASWVRGTNAFLPSDIAVQWAREVPDAFHSRACAVSRRYVYVLLQSPVRPSVEAGRVGWVFRPLNEAALQQAAGYLVGKHDFTSFRASACQALSPVKHLQHIGISRRATLAHVDAGAVSADRPEHQEFATCYWRFEFEANAFLHHMIRNLMGCLVAVGAGKYPPTWVLDVLAARSRDAAAPTFAADGLYFLGPVYEDHWGLPKHAPAYDWLP